MGARHTCVLRAKNKHYFHFSVWLCDYIESLYRCVWLLCVSLCVRARTSKVCVLLNEGPPLWGDRFVPSASASAHPRGNRAPRYGRIVRIPRRFGGYMQPGLWCPLLLLDQWQSRERISAHFTTTADLLGAKTCRGSSVAGIVVDMLGRLARWFHSSTDGL